MHKSMTGITVKSAAKGEVSAVFSTFNVIDKDGDVTLPDAIADGTEIVISAYGHGSWSGLLPVGKGVIRKTDTEAIVDAKFFLDTTQGRDTFNTVKGLGPLQEWSYSLHNVVSEWGEWDGKEARILKSITVKEASPVLIGAGVNTRTLEAKGNQPGKPTSGVITSEPVGGYEQLVKSHAWRDVTSDPESKGSYAFHYRTAAGEVDTRACLKGIAWLNGAKGAPIIPESDRQGVYDVLAGALEDMDFRAPDLKGERGMGFTAELSVALVDVETALDRAGEVLALRSAKGKGLGTEASLLVEWVKELLRSAQDVLDTPEEAFDREYLRLIQNIKPKGSES